MRGLRTSFSPGGLILCYHRVAELETDPQLLAVSPHHFEQHLEFLSKNANLMSLTDLVQSLLKKNIPNQAVAITFDDGYSDNLHEASPILRKYNAPATFFVTTDFMDSTTEFWWDELEQILLRPGVLALNPRMELNEIRREWSLDQFVNYTSEDFERHRSWNVTIASSPTPRHAIFRELSQLLHDLGVDRRQQVLRQVRGWRQGEFVMRTTHRPMTRQEVLSLSSQEEIEVGAHTCSHVSLSRLSPALQAGEIIRSRSKLLEIGCGKVRHFAYPFGTHRDFTSETSQMVKEAGFSSACTTTGDIVWRNADSFALPRRTVRDWDGKRFADQLKCWFKG